MEIINKLEGERLQEVQEKLRAGGDLTLEDMPYIEVRLKVYLNEPVPVSEHSTRHLMWMRQEGLVARDNNEVIIATNSTTLGDGSMIVDLLTDKNKKLVEFVIPAKETLEKLYTLYEESVCPNCGKTLHHGAYTFFCLDCFYSREIVE